MNRNIYIDYVEIDNLAGNVLRVEAEDQSVTKADEQDIIHDSDASGNFACGMLIDGDLSPLILLESVGNILSVFGLVVINF